MRHQLAFLILVAALVPLPGICQQTKSKAAGASTAILWVDPGHIGSRNLFDGPGGTKHEPKGTMKFVEEDLEGSSPKFDVRDQEDRKWRAKLGFEARPETAASRILWAVGFIANENYFVQDLQVEQLPRLRRGVQFVGQNNHVHQVRLQRHPAKRVGTWSWRHNPFNRTREFNGLRVMMALLSNWDLKEENNAIFDDAKAGRKLYAVSDVGASFGRMGKSYTDSITKGNLAAYRRSKFISKITADYVDFNFPTHPPLLYFFNFPMFFRHVRTRWVGKHIPRSDARWVGGLLAQLSGEQIRDAFRAAGYTPEQVEAYTAAVQTRIAALASL